MAQPQKITQRIQLGFWLVCVSFFWVSCGGSGLEEAVKPGSTSSSGSNLSKLDSEKKKFFSVFENLDPAKDISFKVDIFSFLSTDSITVTNLTTKEFNPSIDGAEIVTDKVLRFTKGFSAMVKLVVTLSCGKFVLGELKILFCPQSISEVKAAMLWDEDITYAAQAQKLLVASNRAILINGVTVGAIDNIDSLIAAVEKSEALPTPAPGGGGGGGSGDGSGSGTTSQPTSVGDTIGKDKLDTAKTQASASPTPVPTLQEISSISEVGSLTIVDTNVGIYSFGGITPIGDASYITNNANFAVVLGASSGMGGSKLILVDLGEVVPQGGSAPTSYSPTLISTTNLSDLTGVNSNTIFRRVGSNASGSKLYVGGQYQEGVDTWNMQLVSLGVLLSGVGLTYSSDFNGNIVSIPMDASISGPASTVSDVSKVGTTSGSMYWFGHTDLSNNKFWFLPVNYTTGSVGAVTQTTFSGNDNALFGGIIPTFSGNTRVEMDASNNFKVALDNWGSGPSPNQFVIANCNSSFSCGHTTYNRTSIGGAENANISPNVTQMYGYSDKYLGSAIFDSSLDTLTVFQTTRSDVTVGSTASGTISSYKSLTTPANDEIWGVLVSPTGNYAVMIVKIGSRIAFKVVKINR